MLMLFLKKKKAPKESDANLIAMYRNSLDAKYIGEVYQRYTHLVYGVCLKYLKNEEDSKDAVMEVFEKIADELKRHNVENFQSWLHSVAKNHCLMKLRKAQSVHKREGAYRKFAEAVMENNGELHLIGEEEQESLLERLSEGIHTLKTEQKTCIQLFYFQEKSYQEIADSTGYSLKQVKSYLQNGKRKLKIYLTTKR